MSYQETVLATRRLLLSEGINPDDASNEVWADACQRVGSQPMPVHPPEPWHDAPASTGKPIDLGTYL